MVSPKRMAISVRCLRRALWCQESADSVNEDRHLIDKFLWLNDLRIFHYRQAFTIAIPLIKAQYLDLNNLQQWMYSRVNSRNSLPNMWIQTSCDFHTIGFDLSRLVKITPALSKFGRPFGNLQSPSNESPLC